MFYFEFCRQYIHIHSLNKIDVLVTTTFSYSNIETSNKIKLKWQLKWLYLLLNHSICKCFSANKIEYEEGKKKSLKNREMVFGISLQNQINNINIDICRRCDSIAVILQKKTMDFHRTNRHSKHHQIHILFIQCNKIGITRYLILSNPSNYIVLCVHQKTWIKNKSKRFVWKKICFSASIRFPKMTIDEPKVLMPCAFKSRIFRIKINVKIIPSNHFILTLKLCRRLFIFA